jgi:hypothetical protein
MKCGAPCASPADRIGGQESRSRAAASSDAVELTARTKDNYIVAVPGSTGNYIVLQFGYGKHMRAHYVDRLQMAGREEPDPPPIC